MEYQALWIISVLGAATLYGVFRKMSGGFGPMNLRAIGLVLIAVVAAVLAIVKTDNLNAAMGILAAIAGYLFGANERSAKKQSVGSQVDASAAAFGDNARIAGRDLHETVNNINARVKELGELLALERSAVENLNIHSDIGTTGRTAYLLNTIYERGTAQVGQAIGAVVNHWENKGWKLVGMSSDYQGMDGIFLLFKRGATPGVPYFQTFHGSNSAEP